MADKGKDKSAEKSKQHKLIYRTNSPYTPPKILLTPIKEHNSHIPKSKGKRNRKRKHSTTEDTVTITTPSSKPQVASHLLVGFNNVNRHLETLSATASQGHSGAHPTPAVDPEHARAHVAAVFLFRSLDDVIYSHFPTLCGIATLSHPESPVTRLVLLDSDTEAQLAKILGHARVSMLAVVDPESSGDVPGLQTLLNYVREHVDAIESGWLTEAVSARWLGTKVDVN
ncbi:RNase P and RNase MRP subunit [Elasticomyces elasticus]|nr:RNase P and RNase MRP subunit [Elasticomyces elasticus]KAK3657721.1 RNase P and RNase MRP subunit [Elasticomyces elasticus]KAK4922526.1 RNase P and RNase MRP subunit [Elasticomyces elasticus]KAK5760613.1 RNase P and RNase MRP subunit [Elasticomyces elasticus]